LLARRLGRAGLQDTLQDYYRTITAGPPAVYRLLAELPFSSVITTTWDDLLIQVFGSRPMVRSVLDMDDYSEILRDDQFVILRVRGDLSKPNGIALTIDEYRRVLSANASLARYLATLLDSRSWLFIGANLEDI